MSAFLPDVVALLCANTIFNCEQIKLAYCSSAVLQLVNSMDRKPRAQSPSIGIIMQRALPIVLFFFKEHDLLYESLYGFRTENSTELAPIEIKWGYIEFKYYADAIHFDLTPLV